MFLSVTLRSLSLLSIDTKIAFRSPFTTSVQVLSSSSTSAEYADYARPKVLLSGNWATARTTGSPDSEAGAARKRGRVNFSILQDVRARRRDYAPAAACGKNARAPTKRPRKLNKRILNTCTRPESFEERIQAVGAATATCHVRLPFLEDTNSRERASWCVWRLSSASAMVLSLAASGQCSITCKDFAACVTFSYTVDRIGHSSMGLGTSYRMFD